MKKHLCYTLIFKKYVCAKNEGMKVDNGGDNNNNKLIMIRRWRIMRKRMLMRRM